ncbi:MAG: NAD(P)H-hydrate epimerase [Saprospiraceae bacterium]|nr:NAD(P)H-hydrate epimerase [Saprospiraceae bacterium]
MSRIKAYEKEIQHLTTFQMIEVDRLMIEEYGISLLQMMENAGRCLSTAVKRFLKRKLKTKRVVVLAGTGGNGGGAMVYARRLHNLGAKVIVYLSAEQDRMSPVAQLQLNTLKRMGIRIKRADKLANAKPVALVINLTFCTIFCNIYIGAG